MDEKYEIYSVDAEMYNCNKYYPNCIAYVLKWDANIGFGELTFIYDTKTKEWSYDSECMGKDFCLAVLKKWLSDLMGKGF